MESSIQAREGGSSQEEPREETVTGNNPDTGGLVDRHRPTLSKRGWSKINLHWEVKYLAISNC